MIINYNSLSRGRDAWLKNDVGDLFGSPPINFGTVSKKSWLMSMLMLCCLLAGSNAWAQANLFSFSSTTGNSLTAIPSPTVVTTVTTGSADDGTNLVSPSGFTFPYNGTNYTQFLMTTNGWLKMGNVAPSGTIASSLTSVVADGVYAFGRDGNLNVANGGSLTHGATADGKYVFQIVKLSGGGSGSASATVHSTSQIVLWGSTSATPGKIEIIYGASAGTPSTGGAIGISDSAGRYTNAVTGTTTATTTASAWPASGVMYTFLPPAPCSGTPSGGTVAPTAQQVCTGSTPLALTATGFTTGATGLTFQWQQSTDNGATWTNTTTGTGGTTATYTPASYAGSTIQYRVARICSASSLSGYSNAVTINPVVAPTTQASALTTSFSPTQIVASWTAGNGGRRMVVISNTAIVDPVNGSAAALTANAAYAGTGQQIVFDGTGSTVTITGLICNTAYNIKVYDYNRCGSGPYTYTYNVSTGTNAATVTPSTLNGTMPATVSFTGFTGANLSTVFPGWYESKGTAQNLNPAGTASDWTNTSLGGFTTARINLFGTAKNDWIISPKLALTGNSRITFKAAITDWNSTSADAGRMQGTDDKVRVLISTDGCGASWTALYTFEASNTTALTNVLTDFIVDIPASYNGQTVQLAFQAIDGPTDDTPDYDFHIADLKVELTPSCNGVTGVNFTNLTAATADFAWTASSSAPANGYDWEIRTSGAAGSGGAVASGSTAAGVVTATAAGLTGNTTYTLYVRSHCSGSDYSAWTSGTAFTTLCAAHAVPYTLDFESATVPAMPVCTSIQNAGTGNNWITANNPGSGFTSKTLRYSYNSSNAANAWFFTQGVNLVANTTYALSYKYGANSTYIEKLKVAYATTANAASMTTILADHPSITGTVPSTNIVYFTPTISGAYFFGFNAYSALDQNGLFVDDISVNVAPSCIPPSGLTATAGAATTTLSWTAAVSVPSSGYDWEVRFSGAAGSGSTGLAANGNTAAVTVNAALTPLTTYTAYVRSNCGGADTSTWIASATFTTPCAASEVPYVQDFSSATVPGMPSCTTSQNLSLANNWVTTEEVFDGLFPASQGKYLLYSYDEDYNANTWFYTNAINLTGGVEYAISYKYGNDNGTTYPERMKVAYGTSATSTAMTNPLADYTSITTANNTAFILFTPTVSGAYYFGFNAYSLADNDVLQLDDIKVDLAPTCRMPSALTIVPGVTNASLSWTAPTLGAAGYEWAVTTSDVPPTSGTAVATTTATVGSLAADTFYYLHVRSTCSGSDVSDWVSKLFITGYCMSTTTIASSEYISSFVTTGGAVNISNTGTTSDSRGYSNYTSMIAGNYEGVATAFTITPSSGSLYTYGASIFIDWNNDLDFDDTNERVYAAPTSTSTSPRTGTISIPAGTPLGNYRMRVRTDYINYASQISACGNIQVGETEDYTFAVLPVPPAITNFTPTAVCSNDLATTVVTITGTNFTGVTEVKLNDVVTPHTVVSATSITVNLNAASTSGFFNLYKSGDGSSTVSASPLEITQSPEVEPITGPTAVCLPASNTITLASETLTGVWSSSNVDVATVSSGGVVTPVAAGTVNINYTVADSGCSTVVSYAVTVSNPIEITASTATQTVVTGGNTSFSVTATGSAAPSESGLTYQWQSTVDGETFVTLTNDAIYGGVNTNTLTLTSVPEELNLTLYNVIISGACTEVVSDLAVLFVGDTGIDTQPNPAFICDSGSGIVNFTVEASSDVTTYEWQEDQGGDNWQTLSDVGIYSGTASPTLTLTGVTAANSGWKYKVIVTGIGSAESNPVSLTVSQTAAVTSEPASQTVCYSGGAANFTVGATNAASYQWQYSADGSTWDNAVNGLPVGVTYSGTASTTLNVTTTPATPTSGLHLYRAIVNSASPCLPAYSASANLYITNVAITTQPVATSVIAGNTGTFNVAATTSAATTYQWQFSTTAGGTYQDVVNGTPANITYTGANTATLSVITAPQTEAGTTGRFYRVVVTSGENGCSLASNGVLLTTTTYCLASFASGPGTTDGISNVTVGTLNNSSTHNNVAPYNTLFTGVTVPDFMVSSTVNVSVTYGSDGTQYGGVWIDFNRNGIFEASEGVVSTTSVGGNATSVFTLNVPAGASLGNTRMRVRGGNDSALTTAQACGVGGGSYGEAEDYIVNIIPVPPCATPVAGTIAASVSNICGSGSTTLTATGYSTNQTGLTFQWYNSQGAIPSANGFTYTTPVLTASETYFFRATCANGGVTADSNSLVINTVNPAITESTPNQRCGAGTVTLGATGAAGSTLNWYANANGGLAIGTGSTFTTPSITDTTTYYVASEYAGPSSGTVGTGTTLTASFGAPTAFNNYNAAYHAQYLVTAAELTAAGLKAGNISSVAFTITTLGSSATNANFKVAIAPTALSTLTTTYVTAGLTTVYGPATYTHAVGVNTVNFATPYSWDGTSNIIVDVSHNGANSSANALTYYTATAGNTVVYSSSLTATTGTTSTNRLNMTFGGYFPCASARTAVVATVTAAPALTLSAPTVSMCAGGSATVNVTSPAANFDTYVWTPAASGGSAATGFTFNPSITTTYNLLATSASGCTNTASVVVTVNPLPTAVVITPASPAICVGETVALTATGGMTSSQMTSGVGTSTSVANSTSATLGPNPLQNYYGGTKQQWIYRASELTALGFVSGSRINSIALNLATANTTPLTGLTVKMKNSTAQSFASTSAWETGMTEVISQISHTPSVGLNTFTLSTPFVWNGTSSLVVEMNYSNDNGGSGTTNTARFSATTYASTIFYRVDDETAAYVNTYTGSAYTTYNSRNDVVFSVEKPGAVAWTPTTGLFTDAGATTPYTGGDFRVVYAKPTNPATYSASVTTTEGCPGTAGSASITINTPTVWYVDADNDNYGNSALPTILACVKPAFYAAVGGDCNDDPATGALVNPGVAEIFYNGIDDNCDGNIDEGRQLTTTILANRCGTKLSKIYHTVNSDFRIANITGYRFRIRKQSDLNNVQTIDRPNPYFSFNQLSQYDYGTTYVIDVMLQRNNIWLGYYGTSCTVATPDVATLAVCGGTVAATGTPIYSEVLLYATGYRFEVTNVATSQVTYISNGHHYFTFNEVAGFTAGAQYSVKVSVKTTGDWSAYGNACVITAPGGSGPEIPTDKIEVATSDVFKVAAYPNPYAESFGLNITTESTAVVNVKVYDMLGKLIEIRNASVTDLKEQRIGERYAAGVYNIIVTQEANVKTLRVIKR